jgi:glycosyltransferase involved in cell wall biosynthesis
LATAWGIILVIEKKCDSVIAIFAFPQGIVASLIGKITGRRVDVLTDGGDVDIIMKNGLVRPSILASLKHAHHVVALNPTKARQLLAFGVISEVSPCIGIDTSRFMYTPFENKEKSSILYVGRLSNEKRPQILIRACRKLRARGMNFRLTLVGDGPLREEVTRMVSDMGLAEMVIVRGYVPHDEIEKFYSKCGIFVLPSVREGVSVALLEALSSGCLCIVSDIDDNIEVLSRGRGITFRTDDEDDLVNALLWALQQPSSAISNITRNARKMIERHYSLDAVGSTLKAILL